MNNFVLIELFPPIIFVSNVARHVLKRESGEQRVGWWCRRRRKKKRETVRVLYVCHVGWWYNPFSYTNVILV